MKRSKKLKILLANPFSTVLKGIFAQSEEMYKKLLIKDNKIDKLPTIDLLELFPHFEDTLSTYSYLAGTSLATDLILLKKFAEGFPACNYLEIGTWRGESLKNVSEVAAHCTSVTLPPDEMIIKHKDKDFNEIHGFFSRNINNMTEILHNSHTYDFNQLKQKFDLIFIDGDHSYEGVLNDTRKTFNLRKDSSSIIVWHDYGFTTERIRYSTLKAIIDGIPTEYHKNLYHISNTMCAVYMENNSLPTYESRFPATPNKIFSVELKAKKL